jgi:hypothetical protein
MSKEEAVDMDPEIPHSSEPGLGRLLKRRARAMRRSRSIQGKEYRSWGEYAPKTLQTTGDHSTVGYCAYVAICCGAIVIVPLIIGLLNLSSPVTEGVPLEWRLTRLLVFLLPFLLIAAALPLSILAHNRWQAWKARRKG